MTTENDTTSTIMDFNEALNVLDNASSESFVKEAWVPSLNRTVKVKELNAKQQKSLIESAIDSTDLKFTFSKVFYNILLENVLEDKSVIDSFTIIDKNSIAFSMRSQLSDTINIVFQEEPRVENKVVISDILEKFKNYTHPEPEKIVFSKDTFEIQVDIKSPYYSEEVQQDPVYYGETKNKDKAEEIKNIIVGTFLGETAKYINEITINGNILGYNSLTIKQKLQFVEKLPASLIQNIIDKIANIKTNLEKLSTVSYEDHTKLINVDSLLFVNT
jgi:hypothetical protein